MRIWSLLLAVMALGCATAHQSVAQAPLRPGDVVQVRLSGVPGEDVAQFSAPYTIDSRGNLNMPYIGEIKAAGLLPAEVQRSIESKLKLDRIYTNPTVTVSTEGSAVFVNVGGSVNGPGRIPYTPDMTLMVAINAAGGPNDFAGNRIRLTRDGREYIYDMKKLRRNPETDPRVLPGDQVFVDQSFF